MPLSLVGTDQGTAPLGEHRVPPDPVQLGDPLPPAEDADGFYRMEVVKDGPRVLFSINGLSLFAWSDPAAVPLGGGYFGIRQMAPLRAAYRNLEVTPLSDGDHVAMT